MRKVIGLTGQSGSGKTIVARMFSDNGFSVIDCDKVAREVVEPNSIGLKELSAEFGSGIIFPDGSLDRKRLAAVVFSDRSRLNELNRIIYPHILAMIKVHINRLLQHGKRYIILDAPTLFEAGADSMCGRIVAVVAPAELRLKRVMLRDGITEEAALMRFSSQHDSAFFEAHADYIIRNDGSLSVLADEAERLCGILKEYCDYEDEKK